MEENTGSCFQHEVSLKPRYAPDSRGNSRTIDNNIGSYGELKLEIDAEVPGGIDKNKLRTLLENARPDVASAA